MSEIKISQQPNAVEVERAILGLSIIHNDLINILLEKTKAEEFYDPKNRHIFQAILKLNSENSPVDFATVGNELEKNGEFEAIGGSEYLLSLADPTYYKTNMESYIDIVKEKAALRRIITFADDTMRRAYEAKDPADSIIGSASEGLSEISDMKTDEGLVKIEDTIQETFDYMNEMAMNPGSITGITTGFRDLDRQLSGLQNSDLVLLAARPSVGKTALGINIGLNAAKSGKKVAVFSLEMSRRQILQRIMSMVTSIDLQSIISGNIEQDEWQILITKLPELKDLDIYVDDTASISLTELRAKTKRLKQDQGVDLVIIDYLQLMTTDSQRVENRQQEISNISRGLKGLAKELNIPVLALSQLSRKSEERSDKRPMLSDLRESGAIEQDADVVMMLYREDYYDEDAEEQNIIEVIVGKHRNGPTGTVKLYFSKEHTKFFDLEYGDSYED